MKGLVIFDLDGTLVEDKSSWRLIYERYSLEVASDKNFSEFEAGKVTYKELVRKTLVDLKIAGAVSKDIGELFSKPTVVPYALEIIQELHQMGFKVAIISAGVCNLVRQVANTLGVDLYFCNEIVFDQDGRISAINVNVDPTKKGEIVERLQAEFNLIPERTVAVGDHQMDASMFSKAGHYMVVGNGYKPGKNGCSISNLGEVLKWIKAWYPNGLE